MLMSALKITVHVGEKLCIWQSHHVAFYIVHALPVQEYTLNLNSSTASYGTGILIESASPENNRCRPLIIIMVLHLKFNFTLSCFEH